VQISCNKGEKQKKFTLQGANQKKNYRGKKQNSHTLQGVSIYLPKKKTVKYSNTVTEFVK
jgi:hypothetical protein